MTGNCELGNISIKSYLTDGEYFPQLNTHFLDEVYEVGTEAFKAEMPNRGPEEIEHVMGGREDLLERLADPSLDKGLLPNQSFQDPVLTVAFADADKSSMRIVGYSFAADAASGSSEQLRRAKQLSIVKNYRWLKIVAVLPDFQGRGIGSILSAAQFAKATILQPASAYTRPSEGSAGTRLVESLGTVETAEDRRPVDMFGTGEMVEQRRYEAKSAKRIAGGVIFRGDDDVKRLLRGQSLRQLKRDERSTLQYLNTWQRPTHG